VKFIRIKKRGVVGNKGVGNEICEEELERRKTDLNMEKIKIKICL